MADAYLLVRTNPSSPDVWDEFNHWYDTVHIPELVELIDGVTGAERYQAGPEQPYRSLAVYFIDSDDPGAVFADIGAAAAGGRLTMSPAVAPDTTMELVHKFH
jgi:hypothetical protein